MIKTRDIPSHVTKVTDIRARKVQRGALSDKTFSELSRQEKDSLIRLIAEQQGLIKPE